MIEEGLWDSLIYHDHVCLFFQDVLCLLGVYEELRHTTFNTLLLRGSRAAKNSRICRPVNQQADSCNRSQKRKKKRQR